MTLVDPISDMITRIRNAQMRALYKVQIPNSKFPLFLLVEVCKYHCLAPNQRHYACTAKRETSGEMIIEFQNPDFRLLPLVEMCKVHRNTSSGN